jgi:hypothetical protein
MLVQQGGTFADTDAFESKARAVCGRARMAGRASKLHHRGIAITSFSMPLTIAGPRLPPFLRHSPFSPASPLERTGFELPRPVIRSRPVVQASVRPFRPLRQSQVTKTSEKS